MTIRMTSHLAYHEIKTDGTLNFQEQLILTYVQKNPNQTRKQIAKALDLETSSVSGRCNALLNKRLIDDSIKGKCPITGKTVGLLKALV